VVATVVAAATTATAVVSTAPPPSSPPLPDLVDGDERERVAAADLTVSRSAAPARGRTAGSSRPGR
jgi:hypothetical protein